MSELNNMVWILMCAALVMVMQGGFCLLETGLVRAKNSINVALKNLMDFVVSTFVFWAWGFALMFGASLSGFVGTSGFLCGPELSPYVLAFLIFQMMFCGTATTIISGAISERTRFVGYLLVSLGVSGVIYPVFGHWAWGGVVAGGSAGWLNSLGFVDFAGSSVVHSIGGWVSLAAVMVVGPRIGRFEKGVTPMRGHNLSLATLGVLILWFGWLGFNGGSTLKIDARIPLIMLNTTLSAAAAGIAALGLSWAVLRRPGVEQVISGIVSGLVGITASCHAVTPLAAICIGVVSGLVCFVAATALERYRIDDVIAAFPVHTCAGAWGTLAVALFGSPELLGTGLGRWHQLAVQVVGIVACACWGFGGGFVLLRIINHLIPLRIASDAERAGLNVSEHAAQTELQELLLEMDQQREKGDFSKHVTVEPHTEVGQIAIQYNRVLDRVSDEIRQNKAILTRLAESHHDTERLLASISSILIGVDARGIVTRWNAAAEKLFQCRSSDIVGERLEDCPIQWLEDSTVRRILAAGTLPESTRLDELWFTDADGQQRLLATTIHPIHENREPRGLLLLGIEMTEQIRLEDQLRRAQKLEAVGQLAAGVAHEINTPMQYLGDNTQYLKTVFERLRNVLGRYEVVLDEAQRGAVTEETIQSTRDTVKKSRVDNLLKEIPEALEDSSKGIQTVSRIVRSMKELAHPDGEDKALIDVNSALENTLTVARSEWKYVAEVETELDPSLPLVPCFAGELNQVMLNLIVNAAHAIGDVVRETPGAKGTIRVETAADEQWLTIKISDTGPGIPEDVQSRIFDPFFTTKQIGKGTGQGLAIAHAVIVEKHGGTISAENQGSGGASFTIRIPISEPSQDPEAKNGQTVCPAHS